VTGNGDELRLLRDAPRLLACSGIQQVTVARALGLAESEVSLWLRRDYMPRRITVRWLRYVQFLAGLRRAEVNQAAARLIAAQMGQDWPYAQETWHHDDAGRVRFGPPDRPGPVGAGRRGGGGLLLRGRVRQQGRPVDPPRCAGQADRVASGPHRGPARVQGPGARLLQPVRSRPPG
jgi:hypothetical protein